MDNTLQESSLVIVDENSGEIVGRVKPGSIITTPEQIEARRNYNNRLKDYEKRKDANSNMGYFYFVFHEHQLGKISAKTVGRLIYLFTYLDYDNRLMIGKNRQMKKSDLHDVLNISRKTADRFWEEVNQTYISENSMGLEMICNDVIRGKLDDKQRLYQKFYIKYIRELYHSVSRSNHKYLGYIYQLLPYINFEYNILCNKTLETNINDIEPLTLTELCDHIGYDKDNFYRLKRIYKSITFNVDGHEEYFVSFVESGNTVRAFVNPHIIYSGSNYEKVEILGAFVKK